MNKNLPAFSLSNDNVLALESDICEYARRFIGFSGHSIYFPAKQLEAEMEFLPEEGRLLVPLRWRGGFLGMLMLSGVDAKAVEQASAFLPDILDMALENLALTRALALDPATGLANEEDFYNSLKREAALLHAMLEDPGQTPGQMPLYKMCLGMVIVEWADAESVASRLDLDICRAVFHKMAAIVKSVLPDDVKCSMLGGYEGRHEFGLILRAPGRAACEKLAAAVKEAIEAGSYVDDLTGARIYPAVAAGHALYPQDMRGSEMRLSRLAQAFLLRDRARLAARFAREKGEDAIMAFNDILARGGKVTENLGRGKLRINLGAAANAREGQLFYVYSGGELRGQIVALETLGDYSICEVVFVEKAGAMPEAGDNLRLVEEGGNAPQNLLSTDILGGNVERLPLSPETQKLKLWSHGEFLATFARASSGLQAFSLGIARLGKAADAGEGSIDPGPFLARLESLFEEQAGIAPVIAGRYGANSLIFLHGEKSTDAVRQFYMALHELAKELNLKITCGIFSYPFLNYSRGDSERCALKALEYARLLPEPAIGVLDSLALNISADRQYSLGDTFGAIEEYKLALLADPANAMARNSLGVCMADIGKREDAVRLFNEALNCADDDGLKAKIYYNLGVVFQKRDEPESAVRYYGKCARLAPGHVYAWLRLGQLNEKKGSRKAARKFYERASALATDMPEIKNIADRRLARLNVEQGDAEKAREMLHEALLRDPEDAATMLLLAKSYLEGNEDLAMAEMLARKSAALCGSDDAWKTLAAVLVEQGKMDEARQARARGSR